MNFRRRLQDDEQMPMATMSDLAFLINVFLMAALLFANNKGLVLELPETASQGKAQTSEVVLDITPDGAVHADGRTVRLEDVGPYVVSVRRTSPGKPVVVKSDRRVEYGKVIDVMDELLKVGITDVALPTALEQGGM